MMRVLVIIQARYNSSRFPGKILEPIIDDKNTIDLIHKRLSYLHKSFSVFNPIEVCIATTTNKLDDISCEYFDSKGYKYYRGDEEDVLQRVVDLAEEKGLTNKDVIVDITGDCPLFDVHFVERSIKTQFLFSYRSNVEKRTWPDGFDVQIYQYGILKQVNTIVSDKKHRYHTGWNILEYEDYFPYKLSKYNYELENEDLSHWGLTLDTEADLLLLRRIFEYFRSWKKEPTVQDIITYLRCNFELLSINNFIKRKTPGEG